MVYEVAPPSVQEDMLRLLVKTLSKGKSNVSVDEDQPLFEGEQVGGRYDGGGGCWPWWRRWRCVGWVGARFRCIVFIVGGEGSVVGGLCSFTAATTDPTLDIFFV